MQYALMPHGVIGYAVVQVDEATGRAEQVAAATTTELGDRIVTLLNRFGLADDDQLDELLERGPRFEVTVDGEDIVDAATAERIGRLLDTVSPGFRPPEVGGPPAAPFPSA